MPANMFRLIRIASIVAAITLAVCAAPDNAAAWQAESLTGDWIGRLDFDSQPVFLRITVGGSVGRRLSADVVLQPLAAISPNNAEVRRITEGWRDVTVAVDGTSWGFDAGSAPNLLHVQVRPGADGSIATIAFRNQKWRTVLHHLAAVDVALEREYAGVYVLPSGNRIYVWRSSLAGPMIGNVRRSDGFLTYLEEVSGRSGSLYPIAAGSYVAGPTSVLPDPVRVRASFRVDEDGRRQLIWQESGAKEVVAIQSTAYRREGIQVEAQPGVLGCDVLIPVHAGKHPAAVLVPGAGANDRYSVYMIAELFAAHGVAALACDKRGTGTSAGDWRLTSFEQQAGDVAAGVRFLQQRTEIDASRVGVFALSEGAWVAPITAAENPRIGFLILAALPTTSRRDSILTSNADRLQRDGASPTEVARYRQFFERYQQAILDNDAAAIERLWQQYSGASWLPATMPTAQTLNDGSWDRPRLTWGYEPGPVLRKIKCPVLAIWGAEDDSFPPALHRPLFEEAMRAAGNADYTHRVIPGADHSFHLVARSFTEVTGFAPEYLRTLVQWISAKVVKRSSVPAPSRGFN